MTFKRFTQIEFLNEPSGSDPFLILYKPSGLASAPLEEGGEGNAVFEAAKRFPEILNVNGKKSCERGLLHRLDTETSGLLLIASTQSAYEALQRAQAEDRFVKYYRAVCKDSPKNPDLLGNFPPTGEMHKLLLEKRKLEITSSFRPFGPERKQVRPVTVLSGTAALKKSGKKSYSTTIYLKKTDIKGDAPGIFYEGGSAAILDDGDMKRTIAAGEKTNRLCLAEAEITRGFRHQVRSHLAWAGFPVAGDPLYDFTKSKTMFSFEAYKMSFPHPVTGKTIVFDVSDFFA